MFQVLRKRGSAWNASPPVWQNLIGETDGTSYDLTDGADYQVYYPFAASASGVATRIRVYCGGSGYVKAAIYEKAGGRTEPQALLSGNSDGTACVAGWNDIVIPSCSLVQGTEYFIAAISDTGIRKLKSTYGIYRYWKKQEYDGFSWPETGPLLGTSDQYNGAICAGYYS